MRPLRLRTYIFYLLAVTVTLPLVMLTYSQYRTIQQSIEQEDVILMEDSLALSNNIVSRIDAAKGLVSMAANVYQIYGPKNTEALDRVLRSILSTVPYFLNIHYGDKNGTTIAFAPPVNKRGESNVGVDHTGRDHWKHIHNRDSIYISDVIQAVGAADVPIINICAPALSKKGEIIGYAVSALDLKVLYDELVFGLELSDSVVYILDKNGAPIYASDHSNSSEPIVDRLELKRLASENGNAQVISRNDASDLVGAIREIPELGWYVGVFKRSEDRDAALFAMVATNLLIFLFLLLITFLIASYAVRPLNNAVNKLIEQVRSGRATPMESEKITSPEELVELQKAFCRILVKVKNHHADKPQPSALKGDADREVELMKEQLSLLESLTAVLPSPLAVVDENGYVRLLNQDGYKFFDKKMPGAVFKEMLKEKFDSSGLSFDEKNFTTPRRLVTSDGKQSFLLQRRALPSNNGGKRNLYLLTPLNSSEGIA